MEAVFGVKAGWEGKRGERGDHRGQCHRTEGGEGRRLERLRMNTLRADTLLCGQEVCNARKRGGNIIINQREVVEK